MGFGKSKSTKKIYFYFYSHGIWNLEFGRGYCFDIRMAVLVCMIIRAILLLVLVRTLGRCRQDLLRSEPCTEMKLLKPFHHPRVPLLPHGRDDPGKVRRRPVTLVRGIPATHQQRCCRRHKCPASAHATRAVDHDRVAGVACRGCLDDSAEQCRCRRCVSRHVIVGPIFEMKMLESVKMRRQRRRY